VLANFGGHLQDYELLVPPSTPSVYMRFFVPSCPYYRYYKFYQSGLGPLGLQGHTSLEESVQVWSDYVRLKSSSTRAQPLLYGTVHEVNSSLVVGAYMCTIATEQPQNKVPVIHNVATRSTTCYKARGPPSWRE